MADKMMEIAADPEAFDKYTFEYEGTWFPPLVTPGILDKLKTFQAREDDLVLATYPKCGTHWMLEILMLMKVDGYVDKVDRLSNPATTFDLCFGLPPDRKRSVMDILNKQDSPRFYITHVPSHFLPPQIWTKKAKVVYVTRNPKDALNSWYNFVNNNPLVKDPVPWDPSYDRFISNKAFFGNWFDHSLGYWNHRNDGHVIFITFEEMKQDIRPVVRRLEKFLGLTITPEGLERIVEHSSLEGMKKTYAKLEEEHEDGKRVTRALGLMPFLQKGVSGGWKVHFTEEQSTKMDKMIKEKLTGTGLDVHYH